MKNNKINLSSFLEEWRDNQRLRLGGRLILAILLIYAVLLFSDGQKSVERESRDLYERIERLKTLTRQSGWPERAQAARAVLVQMESGLFTVESRGLAQANIQTWLDSQIKKTSIDKARVQVDQARSVPGRDDILQVTASVDASFDREKVIELIKRIETNAHIMVIEQLDIIRQKRERFTLVLKAYFQKVLQ